RMSFSPRSKCSERAPRNVCSSATPPLIWKPAAAPVSAPVPCAGDMANSRRWRAGNRTIGSRDPESFASIALLYTATMQPTPAPRPYAVMIDLLLAEWTSFAISAAAKLGIADQLESGSKTTEQLAAQLNLHEDSLYRLLRALAGNGIFHEGAGR